MFSPGRGLAGFPQKILRWHTKSQEDAPIRAQYQASSQTDFRMFEYFNGQSNTPAFYLFKWIKTFIKKFEAVTFIAFNLIGHT